MQLTSVQIKNFKSIDDTGPFGADKVTCLIGKNEAGKSAVLEALYRLNPVEAGVSLTEFDYPRRRIGRLRESQRWKAEGCVYTTWKLTDDDLAAARALFGYQPFAKIEIKIERGYDNVLHHLFEIDESAAKTHWLQHELTADEQAALIGVNTVSDLTAALSAIGEASTSQAELLRALRAAFPEADRYTQFRAFLVERTPTFVLFNEYYKLPGRIALTAFAERQTQPSGLRFDDKVLLALLDLGGTTFAELEQADQRERLIMILESISSEITEQVFEYWTTNKSLRVQFHFGPARPADAPPFNAGNIFEVRIWNDRHQVTTNFDERSTGFIWFFSFLVWLSQVKKNYGERLVILLDEPGLSLHGKAQGDILRYVNDKLRPNYQLLFTTHSPFMIDPDYLLSVRTVEDKNEGEKVLGTKVEDRPLSVSADTILPILGALGIEITQTLFVGKYTLLVEGPSDLLYLRWFSAELQDRKRVALDRRWTICPVEGLAKVSSFASLFSGSLKRIAVLADVHVGEKNALERLRRSDLLKRGHVFSLDSYTGQGEADVEDMIGRAGYVPLVNATYGLAGATALPATKPPEAPLRVVKEVEDHFKVLPAEMSGFDHFQPARFLVENAATMRTAMSNLAEAFDRFERMFTDINAILPKE